MAKQTYWAEDISKWKLPKLDSVTTVFLSLIAGSLTGAAAHEIGHAIAAALLNVPIRFVTPINLVYLGPVEDWKREIIAASGNWGALFSSIALLIPALLPQIKDTRIRFFLGGLSTMHFVVFILCALFGYWH